MSVFSKPQCLVYTDPFSGKLTLQQDVLDELSSVTKQMNVVSITGLYRTGKSYLLNQLAGKIRGFPLGSTIEAQTKGIWAWCLDHPTYDDQALLLLDTEGLGDIRKGNEDHDNQIFTIATLLSSTLIYNFFGAFDQNALDKLRCITEIAKNIKVKENDGEEDDSNFDVYFPEFVLAMRDFSLSLEVDGQEVTPDEYLEHCLEAKSGCDEQVAKFNEPRLRLRKYFKRMKCFIFDRPVSSREDFKRLDELTADDLSDAFIKDTRNFREYILSSCRGLTLKDGTKINGRMFIQLASSYVARIRNGGVPCIMSAVESMAMVENKRAVDNALYLYKSRMKTLVEIPTQDEKTLLDANILCRDEAFHMFMECKVMDEENEYYHDLETELLRYFSEMDKMNRELSLRLCDDTLDSLHRPIRENVSSGHYAIPGGYRLYKQDRDEMERQYNATPNLGVNKQLAFNNFTTRPTTKSEEDSVLVSDRRLSKTQKELERNKLERKEAEKKEALAKKTLEENKKWLEDFKHQVTKEKERLEKTHKENLEKEKKRIEEIAHKRIKEIERLHKERQEEVRIEREKELSMLQKELDVRKKYIDLQSSMLNELNEKRFREIEEETEIHILTDVLIPAAFILFKAFLGLI